MKFPILVLTLLLAGCAVTPPPEPPPGAPYAWWGDDEAGLAMQAALSASYAATRRMETERSTDAWIESQVKWQELMDAFVTWKAIRGWEPESEGE